MKTSLFDFAAKGMKAQIEIDKLCHINDPETSRKAAEKMVESGKLSLIERTGEKRDGCAVWRLI